MKSSCEHNNEPSDFTTFWKIVSRCSTGGFSTRAQLYGLSLLNLMVR
jgi:hypothetical protein